MNLKLIKVNPNSPMHLAVLYHLLGERTPDQSISHKGMPTWDEHLRFVRSEPYAGWYLIQVDGVSVGSTYFSKQNEIGIFVYKRHAGFGYAAKAIAELKLRHAGPYYANINPKNERSIAFFEKLGFRFIQVTYAQE